MIEEVQKGKGFLRVYKTQFYRIFIKLSLLCMLVCVGSGEITVK